MAQENKKDDRKIDREIKGAFIFGGNLTQIEGDQVYNFNKLGIHAGVAGILPIGKRFSFEIETLYNEKGAFRKYPFASADSGSLPWYKCNLTYLEAPFMFHYEDRDTWTFGLGVSYGRLVKATEIEWGGKQDWYRFPYTKNEFDIIADLRFRLYKHLKFNVRYSYSLASIRTRTFDPNNNGGWERKQYNNVITVRLMYLLNEKYLPERHKRVKKKKKQD
ncbi:MAG: porin family protein [Bacteroidota bacterium]